MIPPQDQEKNLRHDGRIMTEPPPQGDIKHGTRPTEAKTSTNNT